MGPTSPQYFSSSLEKGLRILKLFTPDHPELGLSQIVQGTQLNKTVAYRYANTLLQLGYLKKNPQTKLFSLGFQTISLGFNSIQNTDILQMARPLIDEAFEKNNITIELSLFDEDSVVMVYRREIPEVLMARPKMFYRTDHLYCTAVGKAILSQLSMADLMKLIEHIPLIKRTDNTIISMDKLLADLEKTRKRGYAINNEEYIPGLVTLGAPILNIQTKKVKGAISFESSTIQLSINRLEKIYADRIIYLGNEISKRLTYVLWGDS
jgi:DNA-binding IclR family transcriptional regulator